MSLNREPSGRGSQQVLLVRCQPLHRTRTEADLDVAALLVEAAHRVCAAADGTNN
jgi:hypothetical protein